MKVDEQIKAAINAYEAQFARYKIGWDPPDIRGPCHVLLAGKDEHGRDDEVVFGPATKEKCFAWVRERCIRAAMPVAVAAARSAERERCARFLRDLAEARKAKLGNGGDFEVAAEVIRAMIDDEPPPLIGTVTDFTPRS